VTTILAIIATLTSLVALMLWVRLMDVRIDNRNLAKRSDDHLRKLDKLRTDRNRLLKRVSALSDELNAVPNIPDPVAYLRDLVERFKRVGGGL
jgi:hypothetical protein